MNDKAPHFVVGHKNPDSDTVVCAHVLAWIHQQLNQASSATPICLGKVNSQSEWLFDQAGCELPKIRKSCHYTAQEIAKPAPTVRSDTPLREALETMQRASTEFVTIVDEDNHPLGVVSDRTQRTNYLLQCNIEDFVGTLLDFDHLIKGLPLERISGNEATGIEHLDVPMHKSNVRGGWDSKTAIIIGDREYFLNTINDSPPGAVIITGVDAARAKEIASKLGCPVYVYSGSAISMMTRLPGCFPASAAMAEEFQSIDVSATEDQISRGLKKSQWGLLVTDASGRVAGSICPMDFLNIERPKVSLVDHSERGQSIEGLQDAEVIEIIDHHRLGDVETIQPLHIDVRPLGSTASILYDRILDAGIELPPSIAKLLLGALISDTLLLTSPTCTESDKTRAEALAEIAGVNLRTYGIEVLRQNDELTTAAPEHLVRRDCKSFTFEGITFIAAQIETVDLASLDEGRLNSIESAFASAIKSDGAEFGALMITDVLASKSLIVIVGEDDKWQAIHLPDALQRSDENWIEDGFVSRKKQLIPLLLTNIKASLQ